jgi:transposase InsO family protein
MRCCVRSPDERVNAKLGISIERVMTDNGSCYRSKTFQAVCRRLGIRQIFTKPYTPRTNGKAERFIQTAVCTENSNSDIMVMQSAKDRVGMDTSSSLNWARERRVLI